MTKPKFVPLSSYRELSSDEMIARSSDYCEEISQRRTVRHFSDRPVPREVIENCIRAAGSAPSGANRQPWHFAVVGNADIKRKIREGAEEEEREFYSSRAPQEWLDVLRPLGTDEHKPFLETAPYLIVIFLERYGLSADQTKTKHYYAVESVGIATGILISALHHSGLVSLTHTPSPMGFLNKILDRPSNEKPFLILVTGYPSVDAKVPDISKKTIDEISTFL